MPFSLSRLISFRLISFVMGTVGMDKHGEGISHFTVLVSDTPISERVDIYSHITSFGLASLSRVESGLFRGRHPTRKKGCRRS
jgi:hypothetical protein